MACALYFNKINIKKNSNQIVKPKTRKSFKTEMGTRHSVKLRNHQEPQELNAVSECVGSSRGSNECKMDWRKEEPQKSLIFYSVCSASGFGLRLLELHESPTAESQKCKPGRVPSILTAKKSNRSTVDLKRPKQSNGYALP